MKRYIINNWTDEDKLEALQHGVGYVNKKHKAIEEEKQKQSLIEFGYSDTFANWLISEGKYDIAFAVGSQPDLSMDMKVLVIMRNDD